MHAHTVQYNTQDENFTVLLYTGIVRIEFILDRY